MVSLCKWPFEWQGASSTHPGHKVATLAAHHCSSTFFQAKGIEQVTLFLLVGIKCGGRGEASPAPSPESGKEEREEQDWRKKVATLAFYFKEC